MIEFEKSLVVVAHPDDEILGCAGLISRLLETRKEVYVLYCNNGSRSRPGSADVPNQIAEVNERLKTSGYFFLSAQSHGFDQYPISYFNDAIASFIEKLEIDTVITHDSGDLHRDHVLINEACMVASRFKPGSKVKNFITFPVISSTEISPVWSFIPSFYVDIESFLEKKIDLMKVYEYEFKAMSANRGQEAIEAWAKFYGLQCNKKFAEPYKIVRAVI